METHTNIDTDSALAGIVPQFPGISYGFVLLPELSTTILNGNSINIDYPLIDDKELTLGGAQSTQAYWTALSDTKHAVDDDKSSQYYAENGDLTVTFNASDITITNTSGSDWSGDLNFMLDRSSRLSTDSPFDTSYANPTSIPKGEPQAGSTALDTGLGVFAIRDFFGILRPLTNQDAGHIQVTT